MLELIRNAVFELQRKFNLDRNQITIAVSSIVAYDLKEEAFTMHPIVNRIVTLNSFEGCTMSTQWPYNEILIYDTEKACFFPERIIKIPYTLIKSYNTNVQTKQIDSKEHT
jgi:hypothetical protein